MVWGEVFANHYFYVSLMLLVFTLERGLLNELVNVACPCSRDFRNRFPSHVYYIIVSFVGGGVMGFIDFFILLPHTPTHSMPCCAWLVACWVGV